MQRDEVQKQNWQRGHRKGCHLHEAVFYRQTVQCSELVCVSHGQSSASQRRNKGMTIGSPKSKTFIPGQNVLCLSASGNTSLRGCFQRRPSPSICTNHLDSVPSIQPKLESKPGLSAPLPPASGTLSLPFSSKAGEQSASEPVRPN